MLVNFLVDMTKYEAERRKDLVWLKVSGDFCCDGGVTMVGVAQSGGQKHGQPGTLQRPTRKQKVRQGQGWGGAGCNQDNVPFRTPPLTIYFQLGPVP